MNAGEVNAVPALAGSAVEQAHCSSCQARLRGCTCYACGQSVQSMVRHFSGMIGDLFDTLLLSAPPLPCRAA